MTDDEVRARYAAFNDWLRSFTAAGVPERVLELAERIRASGKQGPIDPELVTAFGELEASERVMCWSCVTRDGIQELELVERFHHACHLLVLEALDELVETFNARAGEGNA